MVALPESHQTQADERDHRRASSQTIQTVGQVNGIRPCGEEEVHPHHEENHTKHAAGEIQMQQRMLNPSDRHIGCRETRIRRQQNGGHSISGGDHNLEDELGMNGQTQVPLLGHLQKVIDKADQAKAHHAAQRQQCRGGRQRVEAQIAEERARTPADEDGEDDCHSAEGGSSALFQMRLWSILANVLAQMVASDELNGELR